MQFASLDIAPFCATLLPLILNCGYYPCIRVFSDLLLAAQLHLPFAAVAPLLPTISNALNTVTTVLVANTDKENGFSETATALSVAPFPFLDA